MRVFYIALITMPIIASGSAGAATLTVGNGEQFATLPDAVAAASGGDTIDVYANASPYLDEYVNITKALTITGIGTTPIFTQTANTEIGNLEGFLVINANVTVQNLSFQNAAISITDGDNAAGIRYQSGNLTVLNSSFIGNQNGILATPLTAGTGSVTVTNSVFTNNGVATGQDAGFEHALYAGQLNQLTVTGTTITGTQMGNDIKSRAANATISGNTLEDGGTGTASYATDFSNGGNDIFSNNTINQDSNTGNSTMLAYDAEGLDYSSNSLLVIGNSFNNTDSNAVAVNNFSTSVTASVTCNAFNGVQYNTLGPVALSGNVTNGPVPACSVASVPEPSSALGLLTGLVALMLAVTHKRYCVRMVGTEGFEPSTR